MQPQNKQEISFNNSQMSKLYTSSGQPNEMKQQNSLIVNNSAQEHILCSQSENFQDPFAQMILKLYQFGVNFLQQNGIIITQMKSQSQQFNEQNARNKSHIQQKLNNVDIPNQTITPLQYSMQQQSNIQESERNFLKFLQKLKLDQKYNNQLTNNIINFSSYNSSNFTRQNDQNKTQSSKEKTFSKSDLIQQSNNKNSCHSENNQSLKIKISSDDSLQKIFVKELNLNQQRTIQIIQKNKSLQKSLLSKNNTILNSYNDFQQNQRIQQVKYHFQQQKRVIFQRQLVQLKELDINYIQNMFLEKESNKNAYQNEKQKQLKDQNLQQILNNSNQMQQQVYSCKMAQLKKQFIDCIRQKFYQQNEIDKHKLKLLYQQILKQDQKSSLELQNMNPLFTKATLLDFYGRKLYEISDDQALQIFQKSIQIKQKMVINSLYIYQYTDISKTFEFMNNQQYFNMQFRLTDFYQFYGFPHATIVKQDGKMLLLKYNLLESIFVEYNLIGKNNYALKYYGQNSLELSRILIRTGICYLAGNEIPQALTSFYQALSIQNYHNLYQSIQVAIIFQNIGQINKEHYQNYSISLFYYLKSIQILKILKYQEHFFISRYLIIGKLYLQQPNFQIKEARKYLQNALQIANKYNDQKSIFVQQIFVSFFQLSQNYFQIQQYKEAFYFGKRSYDYFKKVYGQNHQNTIQNYNYLLKFKIFGDKQFQFN